MEQLEDKTSKRIKAIAVGYILFFILMRNKAAMRAIGATRHLDVRC